MSLRRGYSPGRQTLALLLILALAGWCAGTIVSMHLHVMPDGRVIVHSHPHDDDTSNPAKQHHSHDQKNYLLYGHVSTLLDKVTVILLFVWFMLASLAVFNSASSVSFRVSRFSRSHAGRAPPAFVS